MTSTPEEVAGSSHFAKAQSRAAKLLEDQDALQRLAAEASDKGSQEDSRLKAVLEDIKTMARLVTAYAKGNYRDVPIEEMVIVVAALIYVISPIDLFPDAIPGGLIDDVAVVAFVLKTVHEQLDRFRAWEAADH